MSTSLYKSVDTIVNEMIADLQASGSKITDFTIGSGARDLLEAWAVNASTTSLQADQLRKDMLLATATGQALDDKAADLLVARKPGVQATGVITATVASPAASPILIPGGWGQLSTVPTPGVTPVAVVTLADATIGVGQTSVAIPAQAVLVGAQGNLPATTKLIPQSPIAGISTQDGFTVTTAFTGGVDVETDDAFRARIPIEVQGRATGTKAAYQAAALRVPGVSSAGVLVPGDNRSQLTTVGLGEVEVYYKGAASLVAEVFSAVQAVKVTGAFAYTGRHANAVDGGFFGPAILVRLDLAATIGVLDGSDTTALAAAAKAAATAYVDSVPVGGTVYQSLIIEAIRAVPGVLTVNVPLTTLCKHSAGTVGDVSVYGDSYPSLDPADQTISVYTI